MAKLKVYTLGINGFIRSEINEALGVEPHIRQASVYAVATTKAHAVQVYAEYGFPNVNMRDSEFRVAGGNDLDALAAAGLLTGPSVWVMPMLSRPGSWVVRMQLGGVPRRVGRLDGPHHCPVYVPEEQL